jgi:hypothetical protein
VGSNPTRGTNFNVADLVGGAQKDAGMYQTSTREQALVLLAEGRSLSFVSQQMGISRAAIREWRDRGPEPIRSPSPCFACDPGGQPDPQPYSRLLGYYLGDGCISRMRSTFALRVSCDRTYPGIIADVTSTIENVHDGGRVCHVRAPGAVVVQNCWNHWPCVFPQHGSGRKHERVLALELWQQEIIEQHPADFLRGLFHSDGCRAKNWATRIVAGKKKRYEYPRWQFTNNSADILRWCQEALDVLEIPWRQSSWKTLSVSTRAGVARLDELIGLKC